MHKIFRQNRAEKVVGTRLQLLHAKILSDSNSMDIRIDYDDSSENACEFYIGKNLQMKICKNDFVFVALVMLVCDFFHC